MAITHKVLFTSDFHFSHVNQMYHHPKRRECAGISLDELRSLPKEDLIKRYDEWLIDLWNSNVNKGDVVYHLGDFCLGNGKRTEYILNRLHGRKMFIRGNHDQSLNDSNRRFLEGLWDKKEAKFNNQMFSFIDPEETFCVELEHEPMLAWNRRPHGACHVHGHTHGSIDRLNEDSLELRVDVGLDGKLANYGFIDIETLYNHFRSIIEKQGCRTFKDYAEWLMAKQGFRM